MLIDFGDGSLIGDLIAAGKLSEMDNKPRAAELYRRAARYVQRADGMMEAIIEDDPNDDAADAVSVLDVWRKEASDLRRVAGK